MQFRLILFAVIALATSSTLNSTTCEAGKSVPSNLIGRSVTVKWTEHRDQIDETTQHHQNVDTLNQLVVYVGASGRVFSRLNDAKAAGAASDQTAGSADATGYGRRDVVFGTHTMSVTNAFRGGARQIRATFAADWSECNGSVVYGHNNNGHAMRQINLHGHVKRLLSVAISGTACEVSQGNMLAR